MHSRRFACAIEIEAEMRFSSGFGLPQPKNDGVLRLETGLQAHFPPGFPQE